MRIAALVVLVLLAGCSGSPPAPAQDDDFGGLEGTVTATTGLIRGVVVDAGIVPIADARISIASIAAATTSNAEGLFLLDALEEGRYDLEISKPGYTTVRQQAQVVAGVARPDIVKVQLVQDTASMPYHVPMVWQGFMECSTSIVQICGAPNTAIQTFCEGDVPPFCDLPQEVTGDDFIEYFHVTKPPTWVQAELAWTSTQRLGDALQVFMEARYLEGGLDTSFDPLDSQAGGSPVLLMADEARINSTRLGHEDPVFGGLVPMQLRVFAGPSDTTAGTAGAVLQQDWEAFVHIFYGYSPPDGWRFTQQPEVPAP